MSHYKILVGPVQKTLAEIPDGSVQCVVTSPPYWGLRAYHGEPGMIGLEPTLQEHIANLVSVFREVRRVMRDDGCVWINYGSSYASSPSKQPNRSPSRQSARAGGTCNTERQGSPSTDSACCGRCGERSGAQSHRSESTSQQHRKSPSPHERKDRDTATLDSSPAGGDCGEPCAQESTSPASSPSSPPSASTRSHAVDCPSCDQTSPPGGHECERMASSTSGTSSTLRPSSPRTSDKLFSGDPRDTACGDPSCAGCGLCWVSSSIPLLGLKAKDNMLLPPLVAMALRADGWWIRSEIVWAKGLSFCPTYAGSCMPSSVRDRPTDSHEMVYLLTKRPRYFYDGYAVREANSPAGAARINSGGGSGMSFGTGADRNAAINSLGSANGRNPRTVWTINPQAMKEAHFACVDEETECLTMRGWLGQDEIKSGDVAAQFDVGTGLLSWGAVEDVARYSVADQEMASAEYRDVSMLLTPNHRCVVQTRRMAGGLHSPKIVRADELKPGHRIPVAAPWGSADGALPMEPAEAELLGWWLAEGWNAGGREFLSQSETANPHKVERIRGLIRDCYKIAQGELFDGSGGGYTETRNEREWRGRPSVEITWRLCGLLSDRLRKFGPKKKLQPSAIGWHAVLIERLLMGLVDGDGSRRDDGRWCFVQKDKRTVDLVQALAIRIGIPARASQRKADGVWVVHASKRNTRSLRGTNGVSSNLSARTYSGVVWCPRLPHGTFVARRRGRVFITGNTFPEKLVRPCILAGTSERGACSECGSPWMRVVEASGGTIGESWHDHDDDLGTGNTKGGHARREGMKDYSRTTTGWEPTCDCLTCDCPKGSVCDGRGSDCLDAVPPPARPCVVLDPFSGSGTTGVVALRHGREYIGCEISEEYAAMSRKRLENALRPDSRPLKVSAGQLDMFGGDA